MAQAERWEKFDELDWKRFFLLQNSFRIAKRNILAKYPWKKVRWVETLICHKTFIKLENFDIYQKQMFDISIRKDSLASFLNHSQTFSGASWS